MKPPRAAFAALVLLTLVPGWSAAADPNEEILSGISAAKAQAAAERAERRAQAAGGAAVAPPPQAPAAKTPKKVDLLPQFADPSTRNQCAIGSCHAFGSVAVLEAAYFRKYKEHVSISEQDVFLRRTVLSGDVYRSFCAGGECKMSEGNDPAGDIRYVLENGALSGGSYTQFAERYVKYREGEQRTMSYLKKQYEESSWIQKLLYDPRAHWKELSTSAESTRILGDMLQGRGSSVSTERGKLKAKLAGFTLRSKNDFGFKPEHKALPPADCLAKGAAQLAALKGELNAARPVCVSMSLSGLPAWGQTDATRDAYHAFMIIGYDETPAGVKFHTRNSWGGTNPDVPETEACRIYVVDSVLAPGETASF